MYETYTKHCARNNLAAETIKMFGTKFLFYTPYASEGLIYDTMSGKDKRVRGWRNVSIIKDNEEKKVVSENEFDKM